MQDWRLSISYQPDKNDRALIVALRSQPRATITDVARQTGLARSTVQMRLNRLETEGIITGYGPDLSHSASGYGVVAFTTLSIAQGSHDQMVANLAAMPEVLEVHVVTGAGDLLCRLASESNDHLHQVLQRIVAIPEVGRVESQLALSSPVLRTLADLVVAEGA